MNTCLKLKELGGVSTNQGSLSLNPIIHEYFTSPRNQLVYCRRIAYLAKVLVGNKVYTPTSGRSAAYGEGRMGYTF